ncbi:alpha-mannosidase [Asanoa ishikariensis]|uniref:Alpha-mannosidase n=1 Tax=Asanoa ishikariensis TaxID=137265 RepID=A0A1H3UK37_9ACTN|nr:glycoside hydrolase family 38 C-terminal domain-containing protein [Asanoa ishikariensis]GIF63438.1 alpha-mannosidase [Asanoa ishikariensis]SDZ62195.1 alpha-mannosidase [Asanoa ishikariensis]
MQNYAVFVPHFHWDREWYEPFQVFRHRLVEAFDVVLATAKEDPSFRFTVDGQTAAILDYLEIRPERADEVRALAESGRLALGPWYILLDEFLCSGETIVRNLQFGWSDANALGRAMPLGYLPDMFGHVAQMPQILRRAGITDAALWRGVPGSVAGHAFWWEAPDGSAVRTEFLFDGYDNGLDVILVPAVIDRALDDYSRMTAERWGNDPVLAMVGTDHAAPDPRLGQWLRAADRGIQIATIEEYVTAHARDEVRETVRGELRSHVRGNILPGVLSVRAELKRAMATAERTVDHAERFTATWGGDGEAPFLELAWRKIVESSAHDSVVGSGTDETSDQVGARLAEAEHAARGVRDAALDRRAAAVPSGAYLVANPLPYDRTTVVEVAAELAADTYAARTGDGVLLPAQPVATAPTVLGDETVPAGELDRVLRRIHRRELFGKLIDHYVLEPGLLEFHLADVPTRPEFDLIALRSAVAAAEAEHDGPWRVRTLAAPVVTVAVAVPTPASGSTAIRIESGAVPDTGVTVDGHTLANGRVTVTVEAEGTLELVGEDGTRLAGVGRLVDGGDRGDSYNYGPPRHDLLVEKPTRVTVEVLEPGPVRGAVRVLRDYDWPAALADDVDHRSPTTRPVTVETLVHLHAGEPFARVTTRFVNPSADHRLRFHVPLPEPVTSSAAEGQFSVTERGLTSEGGWGEFPLPTFPASSFVTAGAATVLLEHTAEYEVVGTELAVTLLRAIGAISVNLHPLRDEPAALHLPAPGAQSLGREVVARLAILPSARGWRAAGAVRAAELFRNDASVRRGAATADTPLPPSDSGIRVTGSDIAVSTVRPVAGGTEVRVVAMAPEPVRAALQGPFGAVETTTLLGDPLDRTEAAGELTLELAPWEIRTLRLTR